MVLCSNSIPFSNFVSISQDVIHLFFSLYPVPPILRPDARHTRLRLIWRALIDIVNSIHCAIDMTRYAYIIIRVLLNQSTKITQHLLNYLTPNPNYTISPLFLLTQSLYRKIVHSHKLVWICLRYPLAPAFCWYRAINNCYTTRSRPCLLTQSNIYTSLTYIMHNIGVWICRRLNFTEF